MAFTAVLDANVLFGAYLRDLLLEFSAAGLFEARWTEEIIDELERALGRQYPDRRSSHSVTVTQMRLAFPSAMITDVLHLASDPKCSDDGDQHVLAAALRIAAGAIVTFNLRDFPQRLFDETGVELVHPDEFLLDLADLAPDRADSAIARLLLSYHRPEIQTLELAKALANSQCPKFASYLASREQGIDELVAHIRQVLGDVRFEGFDDSVGR